MYMQDAKPKFEHRDRSQVYLGPVDLEALIGADHAARGIWELLGTLDFSAYESQVVTREGQAGRAATPPRLLAAIWIYGYSLGIGSARALERMQHHEPGLRWLCADEVVNHHTLSDFRTADSQALEELFAHVLAAMERDGLVDLTTVAHDGTKIRAVSGRASYHRRKTLEESLKAARAVVRKMKEQSEEPAAGGEGVDQRRRAAQQRAAAERVERMKRSLKELERRRKKAGKGKGKDKELRVSGSEPEARRMKLADGSYGSAYNVQISTECKSTMIVGIEAVQEVNDTHQLAPAIRRVEKQAGAKRFRMLADGGYATRANVEYASRKKVVLYAPWKGEEARQQGVLVRNGIGPEYGPAAFVAERGGDALVCPAGKLLANQGTARRHGHWKVIYEAQAEDCQACPRQRACRGQEGKAGGKRVERVVESEAMKQYLARMESEEGKRAYKERSRLGEFAQMQIKSVRGLSRFRVKGLDKVRQEAKLWAISYNVAQWIRLAWSKARKPALQPVAVVC